MEDKFFKSVLLRGVYFGLFLAGAITSIFFPIVDSNHIGTLFIIFMSGGTIAIILAWKLESKIGGKEKSKRNQTHMTEDGV
jgi:hypothetical protein